MADLPHAERTLLIRRDKPGFPDGCHPDVQAALVRANMMRRPHSYRFLDAKGHELTRAGLPLRDFDLEPLFDAGDPDAFVADGRFRTLLDALARDDVFVDRNKRAAAQDKRRDYKRWSGGKWSSEVQAVLAALRAHPKRRLTGWCPSTGRLARTRDFRSWMSPFYYQADGARELIQDGLLMGDLTRSDTYHFAPSSIAQVMVDGPSGGVVAFTQEGEIAGRTTLGALAFGSGLLTAFEARRVSWRALKRLAKAWQTRFCVGWYAPNAQWSARSAKHLLDFQGFDRAPSPSEAAGTWLAQVSTHRMAPEAVPLPEFDPAAIPSKPGRLVATLVRAFWLGDEATLLAQAAVAQAGKAEGPAQVANELLAAHRGEAELGYLRDTAARRADLQTRWAAAHSD